LPGCCPEPAVCEAYATAGEEVCVAVLFVHISLLERETQTEGSVVKGCGTGPLVEEEEDDAVVASVRGAMVVSYSALALAGGGYPSVVAVRFCNVVCSAWDRKLGGLLIVIVPGSTER